MDEMPPLKAVHALLHAWTLLRDPILLKDAARRRENCDLLIPRIKELESKLLRLADERESPRFSSRSTRQTTTCF